MEGCMGKQGYSVGKSDLPVDLLLQILNVGWCGLLDTEWSHICAGACRRGASSEASILQARYRTCLIPPQTSLCLCWTAAPSSTAGPCSLCPQPQVVQASCGRSWWLLMVATHRGEGFLREVQARVRPWAGSQAHCKPQ